ncbi:hypothetical protein Tco_0435352, partial [Tanacetum coccineum]
MGPGRNTCLGAWYNVDENDEGGGVGCWSDSRGEVVFGWWWESERRFVVEMMTVVLLAISWWCCEMRRVVVGAGGRPEIVGNSPESGRIWEGGAGNLMGREEKSIDSENIRGESVDAWNAESEDILRNNIHRIKVNDLEELTGELSRWDNALKEANTQRRWYNVDENDEGGGVGCGVPSPLVRWCSVVVGSRRGRFVVEDDDGADGVVRCGEWWVELEVAGDRRKLAGIWPDMGRRRRKNCGEG